MGKIEMMTIGEMAKQCRTTVKTLRHYEKINLLKPSFIDRTNGYRYYTPDQLGVMGVITYLKSLEFSISEIKIIIQDKSFGQIEKFFDEKKKKLDSQIEVLTLKRENVEKRIAFFNQAKELKNKNFGPNGFSVKIMEIPERIVAGSRKKDVFSTAEITQLAFNLMEWKKKYQLEYKEHFFIFHESKYEVLTDFIDYELCFVLFAESLSPLPFVRAIPSGLYAVSGFQGKGTDSLAHVRTMYQWVYDHSFEPAGPLEVYYLKYYLHTLDPNNFSATYQIPVKKS